MKLNTTMFIVTCMSALGISTNALADVNFQIETATGFTSAASCSGPYDPCVSITEGSTNHALKISATSGSGITVTSLNTGVSVVSTGANGPAISGSNTSSAGKPGVYGSSTSNYGVYGTTSGGWPAVGVYGTSTAATNATGVVGVVNGSGSVGVYGETDVGFGAVAGAATGPAGVGVNGASNGSGGKGVYGVCNGACSPSNGGYAGYFDGNVYSSGMYKGSDIRLKKDILDSPYGLQTVLQMHPVTYKLKEGDGHTQVGYIAQEMQKIVPEIVGRDASGMLSLEYAPLVSVLTKAVQEQEKIIERQEARIASLERGRAPVISYLLPGGLGGIALGLVPLGLVAGYRRRKSQEA